MYKGLSERICSIIEARIKSTRLPGKVLLPLAGIPCLQRMIERVKRSCYIDDVIVSTTSEDYDQPIVDLCRRIKCTFYRGPEYDILERDLGAARTNNCDLIVQLTGDCPAIDHRYIDKTIELFYSGKYDYASNTLVHTFPIGFDVQVYPTAVLIKAGQLTDDPIDRIHGSYFIYRNPEIFKCINLEAKGNMVRPDYRLTVDEPADYDLLNAVFKELLPINEDFSAEDIIALLDRRPDLVKINAHVRQKSINEG